MVKLVMGRKVEPCSRGQKTNFEFSRSEYFWLFYRRFEFHQPNWFLVGDLNHKFLFFQIHFCNFYSLRLNPPSSRQILGLAFLIPTLVKDAFRTISNLRCKMAGWGFEFLILFMLKVLPLRPSTINNTMWLDVPLLF